MERQSFEERQTDRHKTNPDKQANRQIDKETKRETGDQKDEHIDNKQTKIALEIPGAISVLYCLIIGDNEKFFTLKEAFHIFLFSLFSLFSFFLFF